MVRMVCLFGSERGASFGSASWLLLPGNLRAFAVFDSLAPRTRPLSAVRNRSGPHLLPSARSGGRVHSALERCLPLLGWLSAACHFSRHNSIPGTSPAGSTLRCALVCIPARIAGYDIRSRFLSECAISLGTLTAHTVGFPPGLPPPRFSTHRFPFLRSPSLMCCTQLLLSTLALLWRFSAFLRLVFIFSSHTLSQTPLPGGQRHGKAADFRILFATERFLQIAYALLGQHGFPLSRDVPEADIRCKKAASGGFQPVLRGIAHLWWELYRTV